MNSHSGILTIPPRIESREVRRRQDRARQAAEGRSLSGLLAWGRGGQDHLHYADLYYLTNYYPNFVVLPNPEPALVGGGWSARGHGALVLPVEGPSTLIVDTKAFRDELSVADDVVYSEDVVGATAEAIARLVPNGIVGIMGSDSLCWSWHEALARTAGARLVHADDIGPQLRLIKSEGELALLRAAAVLGSRAVDAAMEAAVPGATEAEYAAAGIHEVVLGGGVVAGMGISSGPCAHSYCQSQPAPYDGRYVLRAGDMVRLDLYGSIDGYWFDIARGSVVGRQPTEEQQAVLDAARDSVLAGVAAIAPGVTFADVAHRCQEVYDSSVCSARGIALASGYSWGHSLGLAPEPPYLDFGTSIEIRPGMCISVEKRISAPGIGGTSHEESVIVTEDGCEKTSLAR